MPLSGCHHDSCDWVDMPAGNDPGYPHDHFYELNLALDGGNIWQVSLKPGGNATLPASGKLADMNIVRDCVVTLTLADNIRWSFPDNMVPLKLGPSANPNIPHASSRYTFLGRQPATGPANSVTFAATWNRDANPNQDELIICVALEQKLADGSLSPDPLILFIDPDLSNPGGPDN